MYRWVYICDSHAFDLVWRILDWRPQLYTEYSLHSYTRAHVGIISFCSPTREFTRGVLSSLEQTAWPRGEPGRSSDCMDGSVRLCCASMFVQAEHRALFTAVCPFLTLAPFFMLTDFLWRETDRLDWHLKASFRLSYGLLKPCCKIYFKKIKIIIIMDGGLSHIKCGKSNFIFVFSNNNIDKKCLWKVSILYCGPEIDVSVWKINKINWIVIWLVFTVLLHFLY